MIKTIKLTRIHSVGYVFNNITHRLQDQYKGLPGATLKSLRESGTTITHPHKIPLFAFLGDTNTTVLRSSPAWLTEGIPVVITECSFLYEEHRNQAFKTKHTLWADLEPIIRQYPKTTFVLTHFSLRYKENVIRQFFEDMENPPSNIVVWIGGDDDGT